MDCSKYKDSGTAHRCRCGASLHTNHEIDPKKLLYLCDRTNLPFDECMVVIP